MLEVIFLALAVIILLHHKLADTGSADGLRNFYSPVQVPQSNCLSPGISSMLLRHSKF